MQIDSKEYRSLVAVAASKTKALVSRVGSRLVGPGFDSRNLLGFYGEPAIRF